MGRSVKITVKNHVDYAYSNDDGFVIYKLIKENFKDGNKVAISFNGITALNTSFVNSAFIELLNDYDFNFIKQHLTFVDSTNQINSLIKSRFSYESTRTRLLVYN